jgi:hypothetical protein
MITHGRMLLSFLQEVIMSGFHNLMIKVISLARYVNGVAPDISAFAGLIAFIALNSKQA